MRALATNRPPHSAVGLINTQGFRGVWKTGRTSGPGGGEGGMAARWLAVCV